MKLLRRILLTIAVLLVLILGGLLVAYFGFFRGSPEFYQSYEWQGESRQQVAQQAMNKMARAHEMAVDAQAAQRARQEAIRAGRPLPPTAPAAPVTETFTQDELNAFLQQWSGGSKQKWEQYVTEPGIYLHGGRLVLAGQVKELGTVMSLHFEPKIGADGLLRMELVKVMGGRLPLPRAVVTSQLDRIRQPLARHLPDWQKKAQIKPDGTANGDAAAAGMTRLLLASLSGKSVDPVLFIPSASGGGNFLAVKLSEIGVSDSGLRMTVAPLDAREREPILKRLHEAP